LSENKTGLLHLSGHESVKTRHMAKAGEKLVFTGFKPTYQL